MQEMKVLVVEDDDGHIIWIKGLLNREGYTVEVATTTSEAIQALKRENWAALIVDLTLPLNDGTGLMDTNAGEQVLTFCRTHRPYTKCVVLTQRDKSDTETLIRCFEAGAFRWVYKTDDRNKFSSELLKKVRQSVNYYLNDYDGKRFMRDLYSISSGCPIHLVEHECNLTLKISDHKEGYSEKNVFLAIPYTSYEYCQKEIIKTLTAARLRPIIAKEQRAVGDRLCNICFAIRKCKYVIADVSKPDCVNVMYELGLSQALCRKVALLFNEDDDPHNRLNHQDMPWDISSLHPIKYGPNDDGKLHRLSLELANWLLLNATEDIDQGGIEEYKMETFK
jgi:CheY-like chemotaxis protein